MIISTNNLATLDSRAFGTIEHKEGEKGEPEETTTPREKSHELRVFGVSMPIGSTIHPSAVFKSGSIYNGHKSSYLASIPTRKPRVPVAFPMKPVPTARLGSEIFCSMSSSSCDNSQWAFVE
jgi:hypothetical protein